MSNLNADEYGLRPYILKWLRSKEKTMDHHIELLALQKKDKEASEELLRRLENFKEGSKFETVIDGHNCEISIYRGTTRGEKPCVHIKKIGKEKP